MDRVVVIGRGGAGKSVISRRIGDLIDAPVIELDTVFWREGDLRPLPPAEWVRVQDELVRQRPRWVADGDLGPYDVLSVRLRAADTVVMLDYSLPRCAWHALRRSREGLDFWRWVVTYRRRWRPRVLAEVASCAPRAELHVLRGPRDAAELLRRLDPSCSVGRVADEQGWSLRREAGAGDGWLLANTSGRPAKAIEVEFRGRVDGQPWREGVSIRPDVLGAGEETYIRIFRSDTVTDVVVTWRGRLGTRRRWQADLDTGAAPEIEGGGGLDVRTAALQIDRTTVLPLVYTYNGGTGEFESMGYVRLGRLMLPFVTHAAPDTAAGRDAFLLTVLTALAVPEKRARRIVSSAEHGA